MIVYILTYSMTIGHTNFFLGIYGQQEDENKGDDPVIVEISSDEPFLTDPDFTIEEIAEGLSLPTTMAFLGPDDILVLEKDDGTIRRILDGRLLDEPVLDVNVANENERGMLGIATSNSTSPMTYVYVFLTEAEEDGNDECRSAESCGDESPDPLGNRVYRYEWEGGKLINPILLLDLPSTPGPSHNGGVICIGPDGNLYVGIGELLGPSQNPPAEEKTVDGRSGILRVTPDGQPVGNGILGDKHPLNFYYAYGIRNIFGMDFDPLTGKLWDTENGDWKNDEINLVEPGFNSGWKIIQGMISEIDYLLLLEDFEGKGRYSDPELVWRDPVGLTSLIFLDSNKLGDNYLNDLFVGDVHRGNLYHFELSEDRTQLVPRDSTNGKVVEDGDAIDDLRFGGNFGGITDLEVGPDGYLYVVSIGLGKIFRIIPDVNS